MKTFFPYCIALFFAAINIQCACSQTTAVVPVKQIDSLFKQWDNKTTPGCSIGIIRNDSLIYAKGYGMANLEYGVPITPETIFHMASVSKQFTAFSIVLLARQGKLNLDDDIHKYLAWFPDLKQKITIRNLLTHTSGIRDQWQLLAIAGTRIDDVITQEQIVKILSKQQALNFKPGDEYSYSNSGFTMLAEIVRSVTGKSLRKFTDSAIFKPLGMNNTHFHDDYTEIVPNRSYSYDRNDKSGYANSTLSYSNAGATSLFTNIVDLSKWVMNFYDHKVGDRQDMAQLTQKGKLNNGKEIDYALGIAVDTYKGYIRYSHGGADAGYRTYLSVLPELKMGFIIFANNGNFDAGGKTAQITDLFVKDRPAKKTATQTGNKNLDDAILKDTLSVKKFSGDYISEDGAHFTFRLKNRKLYWVVNNSTNLLIKTQKDTFVVFQRPEVKFVFAVDKTKNDIANQYWPDNHRLLARFDTAAKPDKILQTYTGTYYSSELDCSYHIILKNHHLILTNAKYDDAPLKLLADDHLTNDTWWMSHLHILRNSKNQITGFEVNSGRIRHLLFKKAG